MTVVRLTVRPPRGYFLHWASLFGLSVLFHLGILVGVIVLPRVFRPKIKFPEIYSVNLVSLPAGSPGPREASPPAAKVSPPAPPAPKPAPAPPPKAKPQPAIKIPMKVSPKALKPKVAPKPVPSTKPKARETKAEPTSAREESAETPEPPRAQKAGTGGDGAGSAPSGSLGGQGSGTGGGGSGGIVDDPAFQFGWYVSNIQAIVSRNWSQPLKPEITGSLVAVVHFRIHKDGRVDEIVLERTSGDSVLDRSAVRALQDSSPLPPLPFQWSKESIGFRFEFEIHPD
ncbi:MAG TPA: TonB family protein [Candidatus Polarisedimenticolia bacterium]|nr:TonB family protein [Candidatus Polarisedimenticolia bacterium]